MVVGGEGGGVASFGGRHGCDGGQAPSDRLREPAESPPAGMGFCALHHLEYSFEFQPIEDALRNDFLLYLFKGATYQIPGRAVTGMPVNQAGMSLPYPTETFRSKLTASCFITGHLVPGLHGKVEFWSVYHALFMVEGRDEICWRHAEATETAMGEA